MTTAPPNHRASLLAGLRTGGVRSSSANVPHTAALGGAFNVPRFPSQNHPSVFPEEDSDQLADIPPPNVYANNHYGGNRTIPMTAAVDVPTNMFAQQQNHRGMNPNSVPFSPAFPPHMAAAQPNQAQAFQMQMMQLELMKIQAIQAQAEVIAQAQRQQSQSQIQNKRSNLGNTPATAGPLSTSFDLRTATLSAQMRRANQAEQLRAQLGVRGGDDHVPMTAALGGKFGSRSASATVPMSRYDENENAPLPPTPSSTTIISGGTSLGSPLSNNISNNGPSKSDSVSSWRRGGGRTNSVLNGNRSVTSPAVKITPPPAERVSPPPESATSATTATPTTAAPKFRPQPLRFSAAVSQPLPVVAIDSSSTDDNDDASSTSSSKSNTNSSPTTPQSSSSNELLPSREEASKKLYEGLGIGRPASAVGNNHPAVTVSEHVDGQQYAYQVPAATLVAQRAVSQPLRQPRGPPSGADELGPKNFATRIRRQAIGGLGMLMDARERREVVEAY